MQDRPRAIVIAVACLTALLVGLAVWVGVSAAVMPGCSGCHLTGEFGVATSATAHASLDCASCHGGVTIQTRLAFGTAQVFGMHLRVVDPDPSIAAVPSQACDACHADQLDGVTDGAGLRVNHKACGLGAECTDCHSTTAHGDATAWPRAVSMDACYACHATSGATTECDACHTERLPTDRVRSVTFSVTHGPNWQQTHGMGAMSSCSACHEQSRCAGCHGAGVPHGPKFMNEHGAVSASGQADCDGCHTEAFCSNCHRYEMPHPASFTPEHGDIVERDGRAGCSRCHAEPDCNDCHVKHVHPTTLDQLEGLGVIPPTGDGR